MSYYGSGIRKQGERNSPATMVGGMYKLFKNTVFKDLVIYIDDIIIFSDTYKEHVATLQKVLKQL